MAQVTFTLIQGLKIGDAEHQEAVLREASGGDVLAAMEESERLVWGDGPDGTPQPHLVVSPTLVGINVLRRQIVRIGEIKGPLERFDINRLSPADLNLLQVQAQLLEGAASVEVARRGRPDAGGQDD